VEQMRKLIKKYKSFIMYGIFGVLTTIVNLVAYNLCYNRFGMSNTISNILAWIAAVSFAYFTNKLWVFESKSWKWRVLKREVTAFVSCRLATGIMDIIIIFICVDIMGWHAMLMKVLSNILVIILNYIFSKLVIFKQK
jgi:putative flippase GtrA